MNILEIKDYMTCIFMYKFHHNLLPEIYNEYFKCNNEIRPVITRQSNDLYIPIYKSLLSKAFIKYHGVIIWNHFKLSVDINKRLKTFKKYVRLKILGGDQLDNVSC